MKTPSEKIKYRKASELLPADYNPRVMPDEERQALHRSIATYGFLEPLVVNTRTGRIVGGHQRLAVLVELVAAGHEVQGIGTPNGMDTEIPVVEVDLDENQERQLNIALNKISGTFDTVKLKDLLAAVEGDRTLTGFTAGEIQNILAPITVPEESAFSHVRDDDEPEYTQMSFILNRRQKAEVLQALDALRPEDGTAGADVEERRGSLLVELAEKYLKGRKHVQKENADAIHG